ncbi:MAG: hypothetical protein ACKVQK_00065, partial [Burkholderiales bacterium]
MRSTPALRPFPKRGQARFKTRNAFAKLIEPGPLLFVPLLFLCFAPFFSLGAMAQSYPNKPVRAVVGFAVGGQID